MADRLITISIRKYLVKQPRPKRPRKAAAYIRERIAHYTKLAPGDVKLSQELNDLILKHYSKSMVPVKCTVKVGTDTAEVLPFGVEKSVPTVVAKGEGKKDDKKAEPAPTQKQAHQPKPAAPKSESKPAK